jgi:hypothetical protein
MAVTMTVRAAIIDILHRYRRGEVASADDAADQIMALMVPKIRVRQRR